MGKRVEKARGRGMPRIEWEEHMRKMTKEKLMNLQVANSLAKVRKAFLIGLMQPDA
jgi:hypothetical protein